MHAQSTPPCKNKCNELSENEDDSEMNLHIITLSLLCTCSPHDTTNFSVHKQEKENLKVVERNIKKITKSKDFKRYNYPAITITIIETPAT